MADPFKIVQLLDDMPSVSVDYLTLYFATTLGLIFIMSSWVSYRGFKSAKMHGAANPPSRKSSSLPAVLIEMTVCSIGYSFFLFVVMLAVGIAIWLLVLGFVYIPADVYHSTYGGQQMENLVNKLTPYIHRTNNTPGLTGQPILDYCTLSVLVLAPLAGIWATLRRHRPEPAKSAQATRAETGKQDPEKATAAKSVSTAEPEASKPDFAKSDAKSDPAKSNKVQPPAKATPEVAAATVTPAATPTQPVKPTAAAQTETASPSMVQAQKFAAKSTQTPVSENKPVKPQESTAKAPNQSKADEPEKV